MSNISPPPPSLLPGLDRILGVVLGGTLAQAGKPVRVHLRSVLRYASGFHPTRPRRKDDLVHWSASSRAVAFSSWLPPIGPTEDSRLHSLNHAQRTFAPAAARQIAPLRKAPRADRRPLARLRRPPPPLRGGPVFDEYVGPNWARITRRSCRAGRACPPPRHRRRGAIRR